MSISHKVKNDEFSVERAEAFITRDELVAIVGLCLVGLGVVFTLGQANSLDYGSPWWTMFIGIPGLVMVVGGVLAVLRHGHAGLLTGAKIGLGAICVLLALSFLVDPTWSFARGWTLFQGAFWNTAWRWAIVLVGGFILAAGFLSRSIATGTFGALVLLTGVIFAFDISWNAVWPLFIVAVGLGFLATLFRRR